MSERIKGQLRWLRHRYGFRGALVVGAATLALAVIPVPGLAVLPACIAELSRRTRAPRLR